MIEGGNVVWFDEKIILLRIMKSTMNSTKNLLETHWINCFQQWFSTNFIKPFDTFKKLCCKKTKFCIWLKNFPTNWLFFPPCSCMENKYQMLIDASYSSGWPYLTINVPSFAFVQYYMFSIYSLCTGWKNFHQIDYFFPYVHVWKINIKCW